MRNDQIFVLLLVVLLPMSGCFDGGSVGEAEGAQDSDTGGTSDSGSSDTASINDQSRTWYSSGDLTKTGWTDGQLSGFYTIDDDTYMGMGEGFEHENNDSLVYRSIGQSSQRCLDWGPHYDSSTGVLLDGEVCYEWGYPSQPRDWNLTDCTDNGGEPIWYYSWDGSYEYATAPKCRMSFAIINSSVGEALLIYEWSGFSITSTCNGVDLQTYSSGLSGKEYNILPGSALECTHELYREISYGQSSQSIWSIVYAIQDTTVV